MGWYKVVKTIKGHRYVYEQRTWREGRHVRTESRYVGPADGEAPSGSAGHARKPDGAAEKVNTTPAREQPAASKPHELSPTIVEETFDALLKPPSALGRAQSRVLPWMLEGGRGEPGATGRGDRGHACKAQSHPDPPRATSIISFEH